MGERQSGGSGRAPGSGWRLAVARMGGGPPHHDGLKQGAAREVLPVLKLQRKLCVQGSGERHQVAQVQLLDPPGALRGERLARCLKHCRLGGALQEAESGHHRLPVLLELADDPDELHAQVAHRPRASRKTH